MPGPGAPPLCRTVADCLPKFVSRDRASCFARAGTSFGTIPPLKGFFFPFSKEVKNPDPSHCGLFFPPCWGLARGLFLKGAPRGARFPP